jgi:hypothetical protein
MNKDVQISDKLTDRLRGRYACGPHLPNGNPEFGWRQFQAPPIQHEAAAEIERLREALLLIHDMAMNCSNMTDDDDASLMFEKLAGAAVVSLNMSSLNN